MKTYLIGYDLNRPDQNYPELIAAIKELGLWWHQLDSTWVIRSKLTTTQIRDILQNHLDTNDELLVVGLNGEADWVGFSEKGSAWLGKHLRL